MNASKPKTEKHPMYWIENLIDKNCAKIATRYPQGFFQSNGNLKHSVDVDQISNKNGESSLTTLVVPNQKRLFPNQC